MNINNCYYVLFVRLIFRHYFNFEYFYLNLHLYFVPSFERHIKNINILIYNIRYYWHYWNAFFF